MSITFEKTPLIMTLTVHDFVDYQVRIKRLRDDLLISALVGLKFIPD